MGACAGVYLAIVALPHPQAPDALHDRGVHLLGIAAGKGFLPCLQVGLIHAHLQGEINGIGLQVVDRIGRIAAQLLKDGYNALIPDALACGHGAAQCGGLGRPHTLLQPRQLLARGGGVHAAGRGLVPVGGAARNHIVERPHIEIGDGEVGLVEDPRHLQIHGLEQFFQPAHVLHAVSGGEHAVGCLGRADRVEGAGHGPQRIGLPQSEKPRGVERGAPASRLVGAVVHALLAALALLS